MANWLAYGLLETEAERLGLPLHYRTDLTQCDREILSRENAPARFLWIVREWGTDLLRPGTMYAKVMADYYRHGQDGARYYWYEDGRLIPVTPEQGKVLIEKRNSHSLRTVRGRQSYHSRCCHSPDSQATGEHNICNSCPSRTDMHDRQTSPLSGLVSSWATLRISDCQSADSLDISRTNAGARCSEQNG